MADFNVLMIGGRRTGKTSVLASMLDGFQDKFSGSNLTITSKITTSPVLNNKRNSLRNVFVAHSAHEEFDPDANAEPTFDRVDYEFNITIAGEKGSSYSLRFTDVPGEWFIENSDFHTQTIEKLFDESNILIIAVDTPHLMEYDDNKAGFGRFHKSFNGTRVFARNIIDRFIVRSGFSSQKLVLFMPLKCEKYHIASRMHEIPIAIEKGYANLLNYLSELKENCTVAVLPILTMGNFEFSKFKADEKEEIIMHKIRPIPMFSLYRFPNEKSYKEGFSPKYCEQPLVYILTYLLKMAQTVKYPSATGFWQKIKQFGKNLLTFCGILKMADDQDIQQAIIEISKQMERNPQNGFKIIQNSLNL